jgi:dTDP-4-amino-4,6-dideoxygalactose transaminase
LRIRRSLWNRYFEEFNAIDRPFRIQKLRAGTEHNGHAFVLIFPTRESGDSFRDFLKRLGIDSYIGYVPLHSSKMGLKLGYKRDSLPITEDVAFRVVRLPLHASMKAADISSVLEATSKWIKTQ